MPKFAPYGESRLETVGPTPADIAEHVRDLPDSLQNLAFAESVAHYAHVIKLESGTLYLGPPNFEVYDRTIPGSKVPTDYIVGVHNDTVEHTPLRDYMSEGFFMPVNLWGREVSEFGWNMPVREPRQPFFPLDAINTVLDVPPNRQRPSAFSGYIALISVAETNESGILLSYDDRGGADVRVQDPSTYGVAGPSAIVDAARDSVRDNPEDFIALYRTIFPGADRSRGALSVSKVIEITLTTPVAQETPPLTSKIDVMVNPDEPASKRRIFGSFFSRNK